MATPQVSERLLTAEEFYELPDPEQGGKMELVCGRVVTDMPVSGKHAMRAGVLIEYLAPFARQHKLGVVGPEPGILIRRKPDTVRAPDVAFFASASMPAGGIPEEGFVPFPPTLAVEVVSPDDLDREVAAKVADYLEAGVERVWVVRPRLRTVTVHRPGGAAQTITENGVLTSDDAGFSVEGFELPIAAIFD